MAPSKSNYNESYKNDHYDRIVIRVPKGKKELLKKTAQEWEIKDHIGQVSVSQLIIRAVQKCYGIDLSRPDKEE